MALIGSVNGGKLQHWECLRQQRRLARCRVQAVETARKTQLDALSAAERE